MDAQDSTVTDQRSGVRVGENPRLWKLRPLYVGSAGIVESAPKLWDGVLPLTIGRHAPPRTEGPWLVVDDERVSREHARLEQVGDAVVLRDCGSKNGTQLNGQTLPAKGCLPLSDGDVIDVGRSILLVRCEVATHTDAAIASIVGVSAVACQLRCSIAQAAPSGQPVLLLGETGTGKEVAAHALHRLSGRAGKLVPVNCAAVPSTLAESLFFGVQRGAFTGALSSPGVFGEAEGGTLFLDEVGELPIELQAKLLRAIEQREFLPLGSTKAVRSDVRIVAATNRDLAQEMQRGSFRADLYARLAASVLALPPLRERREDVLMLARHFAGGTLSVSPALAEAMVLYRWPFNVRELRNIVARMQVAGGDAALLSTLRSSPQTIAQGSPEIQSVRPLESHPTPSRSELLSLLERYAGNLRRIEQEHGYSRRQLRRWADKFGLNIDRFRIPK
jgi:transcriptional regulator with PAS, ATPase and Fis domain